MIYAKSIEISGKRIGKGYPVFVIAELSANHMHNFDIAVKTIKAIKDSGADAVKLQTYAPEDVTMEADNKYFRIRQGTLWDGKTLFQLYKEACMPWEWQPELMKIARDLGLVCFSTPTDKRGIDFLEKMHVPAYKIPSFEIINLPLIEYAASKGKPIIISTGIATHSEIKDALKICQRAGNSKIAILKCTSAYPAPLDDINLIMISQFQKDFGCIIGLSDHAMSNSVPLVSVAFGAKIIEKHFILDRKLGGPDAAFSLEPKEFKKMVASIREAEESIGFITYALSDEIKRARKFCRSLFVVRDIRKGGRFSEENVRFIRPGYGLGLEYLSRVLGKIATQNIKKGSPLTLEMVKWAAK